MKYYLLKFNWLDNLFTCRNHEYSVKPVQLSLIFIKWTVIFVQLNIYENEESLSL
ncbi:hypothetical protein QE422_001633 [Chryseobacterium sp. SORGH_AS 447]|uniref:hypothetical protein n=1 Tax=Chryseobacterium sp. SORGH_AS_0447 TaxID=3041769 RepID=UPI00278969F2|nr:hypothetical protein [Chryseobacterium sp. SORGH_AS_0447]MDQ1161265.1 hypothetical protein [Chryseobacterium sp. SORGH_AS_0447]